MGSKKKAKSKRRPPSKLILVALKMTRSEHMALKKRASWFAKGNFSAWVRHASLRYKPKSGEVVLQASQPVVKRRVKKKR